MTGRPTTRAPSASASKTVRADGTVSQVRYSKRVAREICERIADGEVWLRICNTGGLPSYATLYTWRRRYPEFAEALEEAREAARDRRAGKPMSAKALRESARQMSDLALKTLARIMQGDGQESAKLAAAREVLDRGHGKPKPAAKTKAKAPPQAEGMTVIVKRFGDVTAEDEAEHDATQALFE